MLPIMTEGYAVMGWRLRRLKASLHSQGEKGSTPPKQNAHGREKQDNRADDFQGDRDRGKVPLLSQEGFQGGLNTALAGEGSREGTNRALVARRY